MNLIINASNLRRGGGCQVATSFLKEISQSNDYSYYVFLSKDVREEIKNISFNKNFTFFDINYNPSNFIGFYKFIKQLRTLEKSIQPDAVFSVFGPSYWTPNCLHIMGFANPWCIYNLREVTQNIPLLIKLKLYISVFIKKRFLKKNSKYFIVETETVKKRLIKSFGFKNENIKVVSNTFNHYFEGDVVECNKIGPKKVGEFRFITISANHINKNLKILKDVALIIIQKGYNVKFVITIPSNEYEKLFSGFNDIILNLGPVRQEECPGLYYKCDALFLPTLLECYTVSYLEAMKMKKPILTSNRDFSKEICQDSAIYFEPEDPISIVHAIECLLFNNLLRDQLIINGIERVGLNISAKQRAFEYLNFIDKIISNYDL